MQYDKSAQQRWRYQGVSEAPGEHPLFQPTNAIDYKVIFHAIQYNMLQMICNSTHCFKYTNAIEYKVIQMQYNAPRSKQIWRAPSVTSNLMQCNRIWDKYS